MKIFLYTFIAFFFSLVPVKIIAQTTPFRIICYVPNWIDVTAFADAFDYSKVTHINFAFQNPDANGNLVESNAGLSTLVAKAHQNNVKVLVSMGGGGAAGGPVMNNYQVQISTSEKRAAFIHKIVLYLKQFNLDGIDVDEEGPAINSNFGPFVKQLTDSLHPAGYLVTAAVGWGGENILNPTLQLFDWINLMAYDLTGSWDQTHPGPHSPYSFAQSMITQYIARGVGKEHIALGVPFYGYGFYKQSGDYTFNQIVSSYPSAYSQDKAGDTIYFNGTVTIWKKTKLALSSVSGIMIWELSQDAGSSMSLLNIISTTVDSAGTNGVNLQAVKVLLKIFPNPAKSTIVIEIPASTKGELFVQLIDMKGCIRKSLTIPNSQDKSLAIDISGLNEGTYICRMVSNTHSSLAIFIKE